MSILFEEEIRDFEPGVENEEFSLRSEYEMSPDGKHIVLEAYHTNPGDKDATYKLWHKYTNTLIELFGLQYSQSLAKDILKIVVAWYQAGYKLQDLKKAIKQGIFKTPTEIEDWLMIADNFPEDALDVRKKDFSLILKTNTDFIDDNLDSKDEEVNFDYFSEDIISYVDEREIPGDILNCMESIRNQEYELLDYIHNIKTQLSKETNQDERARLEQLLEEAKSRLIELKKETLESFDLTYDDVIIFRRILHNEKKAGYIKLPLKTEEEKIDEETENLMIRLTQINTLLGSSEPVDKKQLMQEKREIEKQLREKKSFYEKKCEKIKDMIAKIRRSGINHGKTAYAISLEVKEMLKTLPYPDALIFKIQLNEAWKKRNERLKKIKYKKVDQNTAPSLSF